MHIYIVSIGLNVGDAEPAGQLEFTRDALYLMHAESAWDALNDDILIGEWEGIRERTIHARLASHCAPTEFAALLSDWAEMLGQDCIAFAEYGATEWTLANRSGTVSKGGSFFEYPPHASVIPNRAALNALARWMGSDGN